MRTKFAQTGKAHGLPQIDKQFAKSTSFGLIVDKTNAPHYTLAKFLTNILNPLTQNEYTVKDSFEAFSMTDKFRKNVLIKAIDNVLSMYRYFQIFL